MQLYVQSDGYMYVCMCACMCVCISIYVCMYTCMYVHTYDARARVSLSSRRYCKTPLSSLTVIQPPSPGTPSRRHCYEPPSPPSLLQKQTSPPSRRNCYQTPLSSFTEAASQYCYKTSTAEPLCCAKQRSPSVSFCHPASVSAHAHIRRAARAGQ